MDLCQVMNNAVEQPLRVHIWFAPQSESIQPQYGTDIGKRRLRCLESSIVEQTTSDRIDLTFHLLCERFRLVPRTPLKKVHLPCLCPVWMVQTSPPQLADPAVGLSSMKLDDQLALKNHIVPIARGSGSNLYPLLCLTVISGKSPPGLGLFS
jgi:hypothetical protein